MSINDIGVAIIALAIGSLILSGAISSVRRRRRQRVTARAGAEMTASSNEPEGLPEPEDDCKVVPDGEERASFRCGHDGPTKFHVSLWGMPLKPTKEAVDARELCGQCALDGLVTLCIRCALCGHAIMPGDAVALYAGGGRFRKKIATKIDGQWVGCMRWDCCPSGGFLAGHWTGTEFRPLAGGMSVAAMVFATGKPMHVSMGDGPPKITILDDDRPVDGSPSDADPEDGKTHD